jgi:predicted amidohydrolase YtcJ
VILRRLLLAAILSLGIAQAAAAAPMLALVGGTVVVPDRATVIRADVLIDGARIAKVGPRLRLPRGTKVVNVHGRYVVPGLWDMHAHIAAIGPPGGAPERYVGYGVLGIRDMGGHLFVQQ